MKSLPVEAKQILYDEMPKALIIEGSRIIINLDYKPIKDDEDLDTTFCENLKHIIDPSNSSPIRSSTRDWVENQTAEITNLNSNRDISLDSYSLSEPLLLIDKTKIIGEKDDLHFKLMLLPNRKILAEAKPIHSDEIYTYVIKDTKKIDKILRVCEQGEDLAKCMLQTDLKIINTLCGKVLTSANNEIRDYKISYKAIRQIGNERYLISLVRNDLNWKIFLYSTKDGKQIDISFTESDLKNNFPYLQ